MDMTKFRPADASAAAIQDALTKALETQKGIHKTIAGHKTERDDLLLDGDPKQLAAAEKALQASREAVERIDAVVVQLTSRHAAAERQEAEQRVRDAAAAHELAEAVHAKWWREAGPKIREMVLEGSRYSSERAAAMYNFKDQRFRLTHRYPDAEADIVWPESMLDSNAYDYGEIIQKWVDGISDHNDVQ